MELAAELRKLEEKGITVDSALRARIEQLYDEGRVTRLIVSGLKAPLGIAPGGGFVSLRKTDCAFSRSVALRLREASYRKVQALRGSTPQGTWLRGVIERAVEQMEV